MNLFKQFSAVKKFIQKEQYREARDILQKILHRVPQNKQAQQALEIVNSNLGLIHSDSLITGQSTNRAVPYFEDINVLTELYHSKQFEAALVKVLQLIEHHSTDANLFYIQGTCFSGLKKFNDAITSFEKAIALNPEFVLALMKIGSIYIEKEDYPTAQKILLKAYSFEEGSHDINTIYHLGLTYLKLKQYEDAVNYFEQCLKIEPEHIAAINGLGVVYKAKSQFYKAIRFFKQALEINPDFYDTLFNLGSCYTSCHRHQEVLNYLLAAQKIKPDSAELFNELGIFYDATGQFDLALLNYEKALELKADYTLAIYNMSLTQLRVGQIKEGALNYEYRWVQDDFPSPRRTFKTPRWNGEELSGKKILIWSEQGIGDEIMYASIIPEFEHLAQKVVIECSKKLVLIFQWTFPWAEVKETGPIKCECFPYYNEFDYQMSAGSLMRFFRHSVEDFKQKQKPFIPRLKEGEQKVRGNLKLADNQLLIGLSWRSSLQTTERNIYYLDVEELAPLQAIKNATFLAVQYDDCLPELDRVRDFGLPIHYYTNIDQKEDLGSTCALLGACDLIISAGTAAAQMAAALGVPTLIFVPTAHFKDSSEYKPIPWHPTVQHLNFHPEHHDRLINQIIEDFPTYIDWANRITSSHRRVVL
jgi:tetratricopeptide (TPR) repeat protein